MSDHPTFTSLIFDLDGTLWNTSELSAAAYTDAIRRDGRLDLTITSDVIRREFGKTLEDIADDLFGDLPTHEERVALMREVDQNNNRFLLKNTRSLLYPQVRETLQELGKRSRLFLVSNCFEDYIHIFLEQNHLEGVFEDFGCVGRTEDNKPANIRAIVCRHCVVNPAYIGDTMGDANASRKAGVPFIYASYGFGDVPGAGMRIDSFPDLMNFVR